MIDDRGFPEKFTRERYRNALEIFFLLFRYCNDVNDIQWAWKIIKRFFIAFSGLKRQNLGNQTQFNEFLMFFRAVQWLKRCLDIFSWKNLLNFILITHSCCEMTIFPEIFFVSTLHFQCICINKKAILPKISRYEINTLLQPMNKKFALTRHRNSSERVYLELHIFTFYINFPCLTTEKIVSDRAKEKTELILKKLKAINKKSEKIEQALIWL